MKKLVFAALFSIAAIATSSAQAIVLITKQGKIHFLSDTKMEKIEGTNKTVNAALDPTTGQMQWGVTVKGFQFEKALMQEHFNENYMESSRFPKATFKGNIEDISNVDFKKDGTYKVKALGNLEIHGVTKAITTDGEVIVKGASVQLKSKFDIKAEDYGIVIPALVRDNIAKSISIDVDATLNPKQPKKE